MDSGIDALRAGSTRALDVMAAAAAEIARATLPTAATPGVPLDSPAAGLPITDDGTVVLPSVDVAEQLTTMMVAGEVHAATVAALRSALAAYRSTLDLVRSS